MEIANQTLLYLVPTPIGNLQDITFRAVEILKTVDVILAEDTRTSSKLLQHYGINTRVESYHIFNEHKIVERLIERLKKGEKMALVSDAGTPSIADPGFLITRACWENGIKMECLPGPTAFVPALVKSGFPTEKFMFLGFIPHKKGKQTFVKEIVTYSFTSVMYESPHRLVKTLEMFVEFLAPERKISVSREISKMFEETNVGTAAEILDHYTKKEVKGEIVIVVEGQK